jgi:hypothetical protein
VKLWLTGVALVVASVPITAIAVASHSRPLLVIVLAALGGCLLCSLATLILDATAWLHAMRRDPRDVPVHLTRFGPQARDFRTSVGRGLPFRPVLVRA